MIARTVLEPGWVEVIVVEKTPILLVVPMAEAKFVPAPEERLTLWPVKGFPELSLTVTVMAELSLPLEFKLLRGLATTVDCVGLGVPMGTGSKVAVGWLLNRICPNPGLTMAEIIFVSGDVDERVAVKTPMESVAPLGGVMLLPDPETAREIVWALSPVLLISRTVTVMVVIWVPLAVKPVLVETDTEEVMSRAMPAGGKGGPGGRLAIRWLLPPLPPQATANMHAAQKLKKLAGVRRMMSPSSLLDF